MCVLPYRVLQNEWKIFVLSSCKRKRHLKKVIYLFDFSSVVVRECNDFSSTTHEKPILCFGGFDVYNLLRRAMQMRGRRHCADYTVYNFINYGCFEEKKTAFVLERFRLSSAVTTALTFHTHLLISRTRPNCTAQYHITLRHQSCGRYCLARVYCVGIVIAWVHCSLRNL